MAADKIIAEIQRIANEPITDEDKEEYRRCLSDPIYFLENYYFIKTPYGRQKIKLRKGQKDAIEIFLQNHFMYVLKSRQVGFTTAALGLALWALLFWGMNIALVEPKKQDAENKIREVLLPALRDWLDLPPPRGRNLFKFFPIKYASDKIQLTSGNVLYGTAPMAGLRGPTVDLLILDEYQSLPDMETFWPEFRPTMTTTAEAYVRALKKIRKGEALSPEEQLLLAKPWGLLIIGTGGIIGHHRYPNAKMAKDDWEAAKRGEEFIPGIGIRLIPFEYHWSAVFDEDYMTAEMDALSKSRNVPVEFIQAEQELKFIHISEVGKLNEDSILFDKVRDFVVNITPVTMSRVKFGSDHFAEIRVYTPVPGEFKVIMGVDVSTGVGEDYSAIEVVDVFTRTQLSEVKAKVYPIELVEVVKHLLQIFPLDNVLYFSVESTRAEEFMARLLEVVPQKKVLGSQGRWGSKKNMWIPGVRLQEKGMKKKVSQIARLALAESHRIILSYELYAQLKKIDWETLHAQTDENDDLASAWLMAIWGTTQVDRLLHAPGEKGREWLLSLGEIQGMSHSMLSAVSEEEKKPKTPDEVIQDMISQFLRLYNIAVPDKSGFNLWE